MKKFWLLILGAGLSMILFLNPIHAAQSTIAEAEGLACMGYDKSRKQTEEEALAQAKRKAAEYASTYIKSETKVKNFELEKDLIEAYALASVKLIQEIERAWYKDPSSGDCFRVRIKAEVVPDSRMMNRVEKGISVDPSGPLVVQAWTDKKEYKESEKIKIYIRGNKPFYARLVYKGASGEMVQILPNPYRSEKYFNGGVIYEIPSGSDRFDLEITPPFGEESIILYASSEPLGEINTAAKGGVFQVKTRVEDVGMKTRGIKIGKKEEGSSVAPKAAQFFEETVRVTTRK
jgi:hypothetical protein